MKKILLKISLFLCCAAPVLAQFEPFDFGLSLNYNYTTTSKLFLQPNSPDPFIRGTFQDLNDIYNSSIELRYRLGDLIAVGLGGEFIEKTFTNRGFVIGGGRADIKDGYRLIPIELTAYYILPFSTSTFKFFMGAGMGIYFGKHIREIGNVSVKDDGSRPGYGIHVVVGLDYFVYDFISIRGQMRFRDPEVELKNRYTDTQVIYHGNTYQLSTPSFASKINIDGVIFTIGAVFHF